MKQLVGGSDVELDNVVKFDKTLLNYATLLNSTISQTGLQLLTDLLRR